MNVDGKTSMVEYDKLGRVGMHTISNSGSRLIGEKYHYNFSTGENRTCGMPTRMEFYKRGTSGAFTYDSSESLYYDYYGTDRLQAVKDVYGQSLQSFKYDEGGRLTIEENARLKRKYEWGYDTDGNILYRKETNTQTNATSTYNYGYTNGRLTSYNGQAIAYDALGNPTTYRNKPVGGRRIKKGNVTYTYDASGNLIESSDGLTYFYGMMGLFAVKDNGTTYFYRKDAQGNIIALLDANGKVVVEYVYDARGNHAVLDANGNDLTDPNHIGNRNPFRYRGYFYDAETGLYYLQTRYYDPEIGRFLNMDDISYATPEQLHGLNLYAYCGNCPVLTAYQSIAPTTSEKSISLFFRRSKGAQQYIKQNFSIPNFIDSGTTAYGIYSSISTVWLNTSYFFLNRNMRSFANDMQMIGVSPKNGLLAFNQFNWSISGVDFIMMGIHVGLDVYDGIQRDVSTGGIILGAGLTIASDIGLLYLNKGLIYVATSVGGLAGPAGTVVGFVLGVIGSVLVDIFLGSWIDDIINKITQW